MRSLALSGLVGWVLLVSGFAALLVSAFATSIPEAALSVATAQAVVTPAAVRYPADSLARVALSRDVFRTDRRPALVGYDPARGAVPLPEGPPKPQLTLTGVVWGERPEAVIEGLPTTVGPRVVGVGDVVGGVTVARIEPGWVVAMGFDTTWTLTVRVPWK